MRFLEVDAGRLCVLGEVPEALEVLRRNTFLRFALDEVILDFGDGTQRISEELHNIGGRFARESLGDIAADRARRVGEAVAEFPAVRDLLNRANRVHLRAQPVGQLPALEFLEMFWHSGEAEQQEPCHVQHVPRATCDVPRAMCDVRRATCDARSLRQYGMTGSPS
jgi:hypothetical protein